jgi:hypothetical protein
MKVILTRLISPLLIALLSVSTAQASAIKQSISPSTANLYIISPQDGDTIKSTFTVTFGLQGMGVAPAGVDRKHTGHHHLLVDKDTLPAFNQPMGGEVIHFGNGQTQTTLTLPKGKHTLQLILGDHHHVPHQPAVISKKITITVE